MAFYFFARTKDGNSTDSGVLKEYAHGADKYFVKSMSDILSQRESLTVDTDVREYAYILQRVAIEFEHLYHHFKPALTD